MDTGHSKLHFLLLCFVLQLCAIHTKASKSISVPCFPADGAALLQLKRSFLDPNLTSWHPGTDCCRWEGIACDTTSGRVIALDLGGHNMQSRRLDPALFNLTSMRNLTLADIDFMSASLPSFGFELLNELVYLDIHNVSFSGQVPIGIARLRKLNTLRLCSSEDYCDLFLEEPSFQTFIANLSSLRELCLGGVDISSSGETWSIALANSVPRLQILTLYGCGLSGSIHYSFSRLYSLVEIDLSYNAIAGKVPDFFADFPLLETLDLTYNDFEGKFPTKIFQIKNLRSLSLFQNLKLSVYLPGFPVDNNLEVLDLQYTKASGFIPVSIINLKYLKYLGLQTEGISKDLPLIGKLPSLDSLQLSGSGLQRPDFSWIGDLRQLTCLVIEDYNFSVPMPSWIGNLTNLQELVVHRCNLRGSIPPWIGNSTQFLDFSSNYLTGKIPRYLLTLPDIQFLDLSLNQFSHLEEIDNPLSSSLYLVNLSDNQICGPIPESYLQLKNLKVLHLESNKLSGTMELSSFWKLKNLKTLGLSNNLLSVVDEEGDYLFPSLPKIKNLFLASCKLTRIPSVLRYLDEITELDLSGNQIDGVIPSWVWENWKDQLFYLNLSHNMFTKLEKFPSPVPLAYLSVLDLSSNRLEGNVPIPQVMPQGKMMRYEIIVDYSDNYFSHIHPNVGEYLREATYLDLSKNKLNGHIPTSICGASKLQHLDLSHNSFSGFIPSCLTQQNLRVLKLRGNQVHGVPPDNIKEGCMLQTIDLNSNYIAGKLPRSLSKCQDLVLLDVGNNQIVDSFPSWMGVLPKLQVLVLRSNQFFGIITDLQENDQIINYFPSLQILDLASNSFSGHLRQGWFNQLKSMMANDNDEGEVVGHKMNTSQGFYRDTITITFKGLEIIFTKILTTFKVIDFSNNSFGGPIPVSIGRLAALHGLNMSYNSFMEKIPSQLGNLTHLESLDLSWNHLSGEIPQELTSLTSLAWLNLSYNELTGTIPQGNQFLSFSNSSFEGNPGLCGSQVSKQCDSPDSTTPRASDHQVSNSLWEGRLDAILLFAFVGLGLGLGFALAIIFLRFCRLDGWNCKCLCIHM